MRLHQNDIIEGSLINLMVDNMLVMSSDDVVVIENVAREYASQGKTAFVYARCPKVYHGSRMLAAFTPENIKYDSVGMQPVRDEGTPSNPDRNTD